VVTGTALAPDDGSAHADPVGVWRPARRSTHVDEASATGAPDLVIHLAAISHLPTAASDPAMAWDVNVTATVRLLHALSQARAAGALAPRVLVIGSAEQYGRQDGAVERARSRRCCAAHRVRGHQGGAGGGGAAGVAGHRPAGDRGAPFNHSGAGQDARFLCRDALTCTAFS
jgi:GDP-4-dehydro-6-deoxy-D-mannose reductase